MVIFYTMAYNAERTLLRTIQSVLDQTQSDWMWYLVDNGSKDSTGKIIDQYAAADARIISLRNKKNGVFSPETYFMALASRHDDTDWFCFLDADDIYYADFLEQMLMFTAEYNLDVAACGSDFVDAETGELREHRTLAEDMILTRPEEFGVYFPDYYQFMRTNWGKLFSVKILKHLDTSRIVRLFYGTDTLYTQETLRIANRFGILAKPLHRYYISHRSRSYTYVPTRFKADQILYQKACSFLINKCGIVSAHNRRFLQVIYSDAVADTVNVIFGSSLTQESKLRKYCTIAANPLTSAAYQECGDESAIHSRKTLLYRTLQAGAALEQQENQHFSAVLQSLLPRCVQIVTPVNASLFLEDPLLLQALLQDVPETLLYGLLTRMERDQAAEKYAIPKMIQTLAAENPLLCQIDDPVFLRKYAGLYRKVWQGGYIDALDEMTGLLLENKVVDGWETFLQLYISLAAIENQVSAFIFGKLQLAMLYLRENRKEECRCVVNELIEMGVDDERLTDICAELDI